MISYHLLWDAMKKKGISTYTLIHKYGFSSNQINRLKHGADIKLSTLNTLCSIAGCTPSDVLTFEPDYISAIRLENRRIMVVAETTQTAYTVNTENANETKKTSTPSKLATKLQSLISDKSLSCRRLSELSGVPLPTIRNLLHGRTNNPRSETLVKLASALGVNVDELAGSI